MKNIDLGPLRIAIRKHKLMIICRDGLYVQTKEEGIARANEKALEARDLYTRMMRSSKNDGSLRYQEWAISKAIGIQNKPKRTGYNASKRNRRTNRSLS